MQQIEKKRALLSILRAIIPNGMAGQSLLSRLKEHLRCLPTPSKIHIILCHSLAQVYLREGMHSHALKLSLELSYHLIVAHYGHDEL